MTLDSERWIFTRRFLAKKGQKNFLKRLDEARNSFPELEGQTVKVGITINVDGKADTKSKAVYFKSRNVSYYVIGHELTHLLQEMGKVPKGERSCDIYTLARRIDFCDEAPTYVKVPRRLLDERGFIRKEFRGMVHETAKTAVTMRELGRRNYISWFEKTLEDILVNKGTEQGKTFKSRESDNEMLLPQTTLKDYIG